MMTSLYLPYRELITYFLLQTQFGEGGETCTVNLGGSTFRQAIRFQESLENLKELGLIDYEVAYRSKVRDFGIWIVIIKNLRIRPVRVVGYAKYGAQVLLLGSEIEAEAKQ